MVENFSVGAQGVVSRASMEARRLHHQRVGTEHLLLGVLSDDEAGPADLLRAAGVSLAAARHKVAEALGSGTGPAERGELPFTPRAQRALERAGRFSRKEGEPEVTPDFVLLGVLDVEGLACQVLRGLGADIDHLRSALGPTRADAPAAPSDDPPEIATVRPLCPTCRAPLDDTLSDTLVAGLTVAYCTACGTALGVTRPES